VVQFALEQGSSFAVMLVVAAAAMVLTGVFYRRAYGTLRPRQWHLLLALRAAAILIVVLLLFRPAFSYYHVSLEKPSVIFLLDASASMGISDDESGESRFNRARKQLETWSSQLDRRFHVHIIEFSERASALPNPSFLAAVTPDGKATSLSAALLAATQEVPKGENPVAVLLSDGIHNSARNPVDVARRLGIVVHTVGVGASLRNNISYRDIQVTGVDCPDRLMLNNKAKIVGLVEGIGLPGRVVSVALEEDDKTVQEKEVTLSDVPGPQKVEFDFRPTVKGRHVYTVRAKAIPEEKIAENNHRQAAAMVVEPGIRVLYLEGTLRGEYGAIVDRFLAKDPDVEFCALIQTRPNVFLTRTNMEGLSLKSIPSDSESLAKFDVFILGDIAASTIKPQQQELLVKRVKEGAGLIMLGGYHSLGPGGYAGTPLGDALPVSVGSKEIGQIGTPFLPLLTPEGRNHPIFANIADFFPTKAASEKETGLPKLEGCTRVEGAKPGASVLAVHPTEANQMPVLAVQPLEKGRVAVFVGDTTRKWQQGPRALDQQSPFLQFWGQTIRWLAGRATTVEAKASIAATTDKGYYEPEEPVKVSAVVRDDKGEGAKSAKVVAKVTGPGVDQTLELRAEANPAGHYAASFVPKTAGRYEFVVETRIGQETLTSDKLLIEAGRTNLEFEKLDLDEKMLAAIAEAAKGQYSHLSTASSLIGRLERSEQQKEQLDTWRLYWPPGFWALFVAVLSVEWVLRRRFQLR
jgi:uncharacterized membrane protein